MKIYRGAGIGGIYRRLFLDLLERGRDVTVRGLACRELPYPVTLIYEEPWRCWMVIPGRRFNPFFAVAEIFWILAGSGSVEWISYYNKNLREFADPGRADFHGAYGKRIFHWGETEDWDGVNQVSEVVAKLVRDPFSRQAVIGLWNPTVDNLVVSRDYPCNNLVYFSLRDSLLRDSWLNMTVVQRSNDLVWGTPYNAVQFCHLLLYCTALLNSALGRQGEDRVRPGTVTYVINNLHLYLERYPETLAQLTSHFQSTGSTEAAGYLEACNSVISEADIMMCWRCINGFRDPHYEQEKDIVGLWSKFGYWSDTLLRTLGIYEAAQRIDSPTILYKEIELLGSPMKDLVIDFWRGSKNPVVKEAIARLT